MKYVPRYEEVVISTVTTANKNIQGYFMKSDQSYYNLEDKSVGNDCSTDLFVVVDEDYVQIGDIGVKIDVYKNCTYNIEKYGTHNCCQDEIYKIFYRIIYSIIDKLKNSTEVNSKNEFKSEVTSNTQNEFIKDSLTIKNKPKMSDLRVHLIFNDFFSRSDIVSLIDVLITQLGMKEIMLIPLSLALAFNLRQKYCSFIYKNGFSFIDDFVLADAYSLNAKVKYILDYEDFVEGFSKLRQLDESLKYSCSECEHKESSEEKITIHVKKEHENGNYSVLTKGNNLVEIFENRVEYLFSKEKAENILEKKYCIGIDFEKAERLEDVYTQAIKGVSLFTSLKCSKDCWMTSYEWRNFRLRSLKEKLLFFI